MMDDIPATDDAPSACADIALKSRAGTALRRGHHPKIALAVEALRREGNLPRHLRVVERNKRVVDWLNANGYAADLPSRSAIASHFKAVDAK